MCEPVDVAITHHQLSAYGQSFRPSRLEMGHLLLHVGPTPPTHHVLFYFMVGPTPLLSSPYSLWPNPLQVPNPTSKISKIPNNIQSLMQRLLSETHFSKTWEKRKRERDLLKCWPCIRYVHFDFYPCYMYQHGTDTQQEISPNFQEISPSHVWLLYFENFSNAVSIVQMLPYWEAFENFENSMNSKRFSR